MKFKDSDTPGKVLCENMSPNPNADALSYQPQRESENDAEAHLPTCVCGLPQAISGIDGGKRVKGIKRHIAVDRNGYPLGMDKSNYGTSGFVPVAGRWVVERTI